MALSCGGIKENRALDVSASERLRAFLSSTASSNARYAAPFRVFFHSIASFRPVAAHSRRYKLMSVW